MECIRFKLWFPRGTTMDSELRRVTCTLEAAGACSYPPGYVDDLILKYKLNGVKYPRILMRVGDPNIRKHGHYSEILQNPRILLDYGCGTGDDMRALVHDGFPPELVVGYDVNWDSIELGYDLYRDRETLGIRFEVNPAFPFSPETFNVVYSGSVLHVLVTKRAIRTYIANAYATLQPGGVFFGSTLGVAKGHPPPQREDRVRWGRHHWWRRLLRRVIFLSQDSLTEILQGIGFLDVEVVPDESFRRLLFYARKSN